MHVSLSLRFSLVLTASGEKHCAERSNKCRIAAKEEAERFARPRAHRAHVDSGTDEPEKLSGAQSCGHA